MMLPYVAADPAKSCRFSLSKKIKEVQGKQPTNIKIKASKIRKTHILNHRGRIWGQQAAEPKASSGQAAAKLVS